jgi:hypothetical protein
LLVEILLTPFEEPQVEGRQAMLKKENQRDKKRFEKLKDAQIERGRGEEKAKQVAAEEVKQMREREGRSKKER